jgi:ubiquinone/menaquinone biosynthesis C-methylase UbiE
MKMQETTFYDDHPFDWTGNYTPHEVDSTMAPPLASFICDVPFDALVLDIGCGPGRVMSCLAAKGCRCWGVDLSQASVQLMMLRTRKTGIVASNLQLPFPDASAERIISDGVIHHTTNPRLAFAECCRVLKPGGLFYAAVYKPGGHYEKLYRFPGFAIRSLVKHPVGKALVHATMMPIYYAVRFAKSRGKTSWHGANNLFYDYFVNPSVEFLSRAEIEHWGRQCGVDTAAYDSNPHLNVHSFLFYKPITARLAKVSAVRANE